MAILTAMLKQRAVYWAVIDGLDSNGEPAWESPVEIPCRWEEASEIQGLGEPLRFKAEVYVREECRTGDYLMLGELDSNTPDDPRAAASWQVQQFDKLPNFKARDFLRKAQAVPSHLTLLEKHARGAAPVTYHRVTAATLTAGVVSKTTTTTSIAVALRSQVDVQDTNVAQGKQLRGTTVFEVPRYLLPAQPGMEDWIVDDLGVRWDVQAFEENRLLRDAWWRISCRRAR